MTRALAGEEVARRIEQAVPGSVVASRGIDVWVQAGQAREVCRFLRHDPELNFDFLNAITGVDYVDHFEVVYHLTSLRHNHSLVIKAKCTGRDSPSLPSVIEVWVGADLQEREVYDLMGITFEGRPSLKRVLLWEGFPGHPLRRDYLEPPR